MGWHQEQTREKPKRYEAIRCLDCKRFLGSKGEAAKDHRGHDVRYSKLDGTIDE